MLTDFFLCSLSRSLLIFTSCWDARTENYHGQLLMYLQKWWWILPMKINQLPKVASSSASSSISYQHYSLLSCPDPISPSLHFFFFFFLHLLSSHFNISTSCGLCSSNHSCVPSHYPVHFALICCPLLPLSPPTFLLPLSFSLHHFLHHHSIHQTE